MAKVMWNIKLLMPPLQDKQLMLHTSQSQVIYLVLCLIRSGSKYLNAIPNLQHPLIVFVITILLTLILLGVICFTIIFFFFNFEKTLITINYRLNITNIKQHKTLGNIYLIHINKINMKRYHKKYDRLLKANSLTEPSYLYIVCNFVFNISNYFSFLVGNNQICRIGILFILSTPLFPPEILTLYP